MKIITSLTALSLFCLFQTVQAQKGSWYLGGQAGFGSSTSKQLNNGSNQSSRTTGWNFSPEIGTFITDKVQTGLALTTGGNKYPDGYLIIGAPVNMVTSNYGAKIYGRHFWGKEPFKPFAGVEGSYIRENSRRGGGSNPTGKYWNNISMIKLNFGFSYALSGRVFVLGEFGTLAYYHSISNSDPNPDNTRVINNSFGFDAGTTGNRFNIGFYYTFKK